MSGLVVALVMGASSPAEACSQTPPELLPSQAAIGAGEAVLVFTDRAPDEGFAVWVDGVEVGGELVDHRVDGGGWLALLPDPPLAEGQAVEVEVNVEYQGQGYPEDGVHHVVGAAVPRLDAGATVDGIDFGELTPASLDSCGPNEASQRLELALSWGPSDEPIRLVIVDDHTDERLARYDADPAGGTADLAVAFQPGQATACLAVEQLLADGQVVRGDVSCADNPDPGAVPGAEDPPPSADEAEAGCGCQAAPAPWGLAALVPLLVGLRRRAQ